MKKLIIAKDFSEFPGARHREDGEYSGDLFFDTKLLPLFEECLARDEKMLVDLDGTNGYATSFLDQAFGKLAKKHTPEKVKKYIEFKSNQEPDLIDEINEYIEDAHNSHE